MDGETPCGWTGYEFLASGSGLRLERWNGIVIQRPESEATWPWINPETLPAWQGYYDGLRATGGRWQWLTPLPDPSFVRHDTLHGTLSFLIRPTASKHLGLFPEQSPNWNWIQETITSASRTTAHDKKKINVLNLFGYTGGATLAAAAAGAAVTHVDAARAMVAWCSENARLSGLGSAPIRYVVEDAVKYLHREIRRGSRYDAVILDPPSFGRGKNGELWRLSDHLPSLLKAVQQVLSDTPLFILLNTYSDLINKLDQEPRFLLRNQLGGQCETVELSLRGTLDRQDLPCGICSRWTP
jgi:23S rRNA (cytosine1962-C5)-methyltransferase